MSNKAISDRVTKNRWAEAQQWEERFWINTQQARARFGKNLVWKALSKFGMVPKYRGDDSNLWWRKQFNDYSFLPARVQNAFEAGCGPYTNVRMMLDRCKFDHLYLSDPLIRTYVKFKLTFVREMYESAGCVLDDHPLEELPFASDYFDLSVMNNVLDHVQDAHRCMENLIRVTKPGGIMIIGQELTREEDMKVVSADEGQIGHPIRVDDQWFKPYLDSRFEPIIYKILTREEGRSPSHHYGTLVFAGKKK